MHVLDAMPEFRPVSLVEKIPIGWTVALAHFSDIADASITTSDAGDALFVLNGLGPVSDGGSLQARLRTALEGS